MHTVHLLRLVRLKQHFMFCYMLVNCCKAKYIAGQLCDWHTGAAIICVLIPCNGWWTTRDPQPAVNLYIFYAANKLCYDRHTGIRPVKNMGGGWWRWALVGPDGVVPSRMVGVCASVNLPLQHKVQKFSSGTGSPGWTRKKGRKVVVCVCMCNKLYYSETEHSVFKCYLSYGNCLEDKRKNYQNCSVLCCVRQLCTMIHAQEWFLKMPVGLGLGLVFLCICLGLAFCVFFWFSLDYLFLCCVF